MKEEGRREGGKEDRGRNMQQRGNDLKTGAERMGEDEDKKRKKPAGKGSEWKVLPRRENVVTEGKVRKVTCAVIKREFNEGRDKIKLVRRQ